MTHIDFYSNAPNRLEYVARLMQKIQMKGQNAVIFGTMPLLNELSEFIWSMRGFLAHDLLSTTAQIDTPVAQTPNTLTLPKTIENCAPFILTNRLIDPLPHREILINLSDERHKLFAQFEHLIEIVPNESLAKQQARERWIAYKNLGYPITHHDISTYKRG